MQRSASHAGPENKFSYPLPIIDNNGKNMAKLKNKVAIVTGGARGIGAACAERLCAEGASVVITDVLDTQGAETATYLQAKGYQAVFLSHDVADATAWERVASYTLERFGRIDCLVNNAGINTPVSFEDATPEQFQQIIDVNLIGPFHGIKTVLPAMKHQGGGSIINISSNSTRKMVAQTAIYGATKAALAYITKAAAIDFGEKGYRIRVNSVHPGATKTDMTGGSDMSEEIAAIMDRIVANIPMKTMGEPEDIAAVVAFLTSEDSRYMTGAELFVDGGASVV